MLIVFNAKMESGRQVPDPGYRLMRKGLMVFIFGTHSSTID